MNDNTPDVAITADATRELTDRIRIHLETACELIKQAFASRAWAALGYGTWDAYCASEFDNSRVRIPREDRAEMVSSMREIGMSTRAIAAATGLSKGTIQNDLAAGGQNCPPDSITGTDGKEYQPKPAVLQQDSSLSTESGDATPTRKRRPITVAFDTARYELVKKAESLARLASDDRFDRYAEQLAHSHRSDLIRVRDAIQTVLDRMPDPTNDLTKE